MLHVFQVTEAEWMAASTAMEAVSEYLKMAGDDESTRELLREFGWPEQVSEEDLDTLKITYVDEPGHPTRTFREALAEMTEPGMIASTEY